MKYIIKETTDETIVVIGNTMHSFLAEGVCGKYRKPTSAGHMRIVNGTVEVYGESIGYDMKARPEDAKIISSYLGIN